MSGLRYFARGCVYGLGLTAAQSAILSAATSNDVLTAMSVVWLTLAFLLDLLTRRRPTETRDAA